MKTLDPAFAAHIGCGATTLATCWRLTRGDGTVLGFTDHDCPLTFDGTAFAPAGSARQCPHAHRRRRLWRALDLAL